MVRVRFRFALGKTPRVRQLMQTYSGKFSSLMRTCASRRMTPQDYTRLALLRRQLPPHATVGMLVDRLVERTPLPSLRLLLDAAPVFDLAPPDLQSYILVALGCVFEDDSHVETTTD